MITIIICGLIGGFLGWAAEADWGDAIDKAGSAFFGMLMGAMMGFVVAMVIGAIDTPDVVTSEKKIPLQSLVDGSDTRGSFFLGSGTINETSVFTWYETTGENSYEQREANASQSTVHFLNDETAPYYVKTTDRYADVPTFDAWRLNISDNEVLDEHYDFYVPRGTIKHNYVLDAQ